MRRKDMYWVVSDEEWRRDGAGAEPPRRGTHGRWGEAWAEARARAIRSGQPHHLVARFSLEHLERLGPVAGLPPLESLDEGGTRRMDTAKRVERSDFDARPFPERVTEMRVDVALTDHEYAVLSFGTRPVDTHERGITFVEGDWWYRYDAIRGTAIEKVRFERRDGRWRATEAWVAGEIDPVRLRLTARSTSDWIRACTRSVPAPR